MADVAPSHHPTPSRERWLGRAALVAAALFWSGNFVAGRALRESIDPVTLNAVRWSIACAILAPFVFRGLWACRPVLRAHVGLVLGLSLTGVIGFQMLVYQALTQLPVVNAVLILATVPVVILGLSALTTGRRFPLGGWLAVVLSIAGVAILLTGGQLGLLAQTRLGGGDLWMLGAVVLWSVYTLLLRRRPGALPGNVLVLATILPALPPLVAAAGVWGGTVFATLSPSDWGLILYIGVFPSLLAFLCWNFGVSKVGPEAAGFFINLMPLFATALAWLLLGEVVSAPQFAGGGLIVAAIILSQRVSG